MNIKFLLVLIKSQGGTKKNFPGRGFSPLKIIEFFPKQDVFPHISSNFWEIWASKQLSKAEVINYLSWTFETRRGINIGWGHGPPLPPSLLKIHQICKTMYLDHKNVFLWSHRKFCPVLLQVLCRPHPYHHTLLTQLKSNLFSSFVAVVVLMG